MPFQVVYSIRKSANGIITFFTAGDDITSICSPSETLEATIIGDDSGHTILWEQISGSAVTWTTPQDQLIVSFTVTTFDDKTFRFWIDKGTPDQQFKDVTVFGTPTDKHYYQGQTDRNCLASYDSPLFCRRPDINLVTNFLFAPQQTSLAGCNSTNYALVWEDPTSGCGGPELVQYVVQEKLVTGPWIDVATIPAGDPTIYTSLTLDASYRVVAVYRDFFNISSYPSYPPTSTLPDRSRVWLFDASASDTHTYEGTTGRANNVTNPTYSVLVRTKLLQEPPPDQHYYQGEAARTNNITNPTYSVLVRTKIIIDNIPPDDHYYQGEAARVNYITNPTYTVLDLTGGGIGGGG